MHPPLSLFWVCAHGRWRPLLLGMVLLGCQLTAHGLGREVTLEEVITAHPTQITWVATCGRWKAAQHEGAYRVIHAAMNGQSLVYIQWVSTDPNGKIKALATASVGEINNDHAEIELSALRCVATANGVTVSAKAYFGHAAQHGRVRVSAFQALGKYRYETLP